jgi:hypothetical protein
MQRRRAGVAVGLLFALAAGRVDGAEITVRAPDGCVDASQLGEQVGVVLGRPLASVSNVDFVVEIELAPRGGWRLHLATVGEQNGGQAAPARSRDLTARTCAELADAAAVAIAMSVRALNEEANGEAIAPPPPPPVEPARPSQVPVVARAATGSPAAPVRRLGVGLTLTALADIGALPNAGIGVELGAVLRMSSVRFVARGALFAPNEKRLANGGGGGFTLGYGALLACLQHALDRPTLFACAGFELGWLSGEGVGVSQPRLGKTTWEAVTVEIGAAIPLSGPLAAVLRGGVGFPLRRPEFVIDPTTRVHRAASLDGRAALGLEYFF